MKEAEKALNTHDRDIDMAQHSTAQHFHAGTYFNRGFIALSLFYFQIRCMHMTYPPQI